MNKFTVSIISFFIFGYSYLSSCLYMDFGHPDIFKSVKEFCCLKIDMNFLVVIIGLYGAILAFFVPLSINMISKIGKMYETEIIAERFKNEDVVKYISLHLLIGITVSSFLLAFHKIFHDLVVLIILLIIATHFLYVITTMFIFIQKLKFYTDTDEVIKSLETEIDDAINK